jgi:hypothetical protein
MTTTQKRDATFWAIQIPGWMLLIYLIVAQGITAFSYELGVAMGTQESAESITEVGTAFWYGFAFGDLVVYIPLFLAGLIGHLRDTHWGRITLAAAMGITLYWPVVCLAALVDARDAAGWNVANEMPYWIVCLTVAAYGALGLWLLLKHPVAREP